MEKSIVVASLVAAAFALPGAASAQDYPAKPIRVIASSAPGGISDIFMRTVGEELGKRWGQAIVIENRVGGGMNIGGRACAEAPPDGYTICIMSNEVVTYNQYLYKSPGFDAEKSIAPVTNLFFLTQMLVVNSSLAVKSLDDLVRLARGLQRASGGFAETGYIGAASSGVPGRRRSEWTDGVGWPDKDRGAEIRRRSVCLSCGRRRGLGRVSNRKDQGAHSHRIGRWRRKMRVCRGHRC